MLMLLCDVVNGVFFVPYWCLYVVVLRLSIDVCGWLFLVVRCALVCACCLLFVVRCLL